MRNKQLMVWLEVIVVDFILRAELEQLLLAEHV